MQSVKKSPKPDDNAYIKVALLLDTSNSMDGLINQAKAQLWQIVNELSLAKYGGKNPHLRIALYEYGNDGLPSKEGYIRQVTAFTDDLDLISEKLFALRTNGGNEYCGQVLQTSLKQLDWGNSKHALNLVFIAGNEPFDQGKVNFRTVAKEAKEKKVVVNTIHCGNYDEGIQGYWKEGALLTGGEYSAIDHNRQKVYVVTPYDEAIILLNNTLNDTYIYYGSQGYKRYQSQSVQDANAMELDEVVLVERAVSKSKSVYKNSSWDLVDAEKEGKVDYKKLDKKQLPKQLQNKSENDLRAYIKEKADKRKQIQKQIEILNKERAKYLQENAKENSEGELETSILNAIKNQAKARNFSF
jgi:hypothetical protein